MVTVPSKRRSGPVVSDTGDIVSVRLEKEERRGGLGVCFFFQAEDGIRDVGVTGVQTCALPIYDVVQRTSAAAYEEAGIGAEDLDVLEVHDAFTIGELVTTEALGLAPPGGAPARVEIGRASRRARVQISGAAVSLKKKLRVSASV